MSIVKVNGYTIGKVRINEVNVKELEKAGFTVIIK